jgi:ankyrin repeat protein
MDIDGVTPLIMASSHGHVEVVRALLAAGANKQHVDNSGDTAVSVAGDGAPDSRAAILALLAAAP